ncbi:MAG: hypothetical protein NT170_03065 [Candidatus Moranbacteria bacterium]|nr:hypothetical protein [Candidatus Moranbacteria bacterium]
MKTIIKIILLAIVSAALAILVEQLVAAVVSAFWQREIIFESYMHFTWFLAFSAVVEEVLKYWAVYFVIRKKFGLEKIKFVIASLFLGAAWGIFEIGLVLFSDQKVLSAFRSGNPQVLFSLGTIVALHTLTAFLMGTFISSNDSSRKLRHFQILLFPVLLHVLFNFLIIQKGNFTDFLTVASLAIGYLAGLIVLAFNFKKLA